jgi:hypothetical protein
MKPNTDNKLEDVDDYPWLWREWVEGKNVTAKGGCAT